MDDIKLAMLGSKEAAKRLTDAGVLVPCPFCGGEAELIDYTLGFDVACKNYGCRGNSYSTYGDDDGDLYFGTVEEARLAWNTRAPIMSAEEMEMLEYGMNFGEHFDIGDPALQIRTDENGNTVASATRKAFVLWKEKIDHYIMDEIIKMCKEHGITDLYVLNRDFILAAIREKIEREEKKWRGKKRLNGSSGSKGAAET